MEREGARGLVRIHCGEGVEDRHRILGGLGAQAIYCWGEGSEEAEADEKEKVGRKEARSDEDGGLGLVGLGWVEGREGERGGRSTRMKSALRTFIREEKKYTLRMNMGGGQRWLQLKPTPANES